MWLSKILLQQSAYPNPSPSFSRYIVEAVSLGTRRTGLDKKLQDFKLLYKSTGQVLQRYATPEVKKLHLGNEKSWYDQRTLLQREIRENEIAARRVRQHLIERDAAITRVPAPNSHTERLKLGPTGVKLLETMERLEGVKTLLLEARERQDAFLKSIEEKEVEAQALASSTAEAEAEAVAARRSVETASDMEVESEDAATLGYDSDARSFEALMEQLDDLGAELEPLEEFQEAIRSRPSSPVQEVDGSLFFTVEETLLHDRVENILQEYKSQEEAQIRMEREARKRLNEENRESFRIIMESMHRDLASSQEAFQAIEAFWQGLDSQAAEEETITQEIEKLRTQDVRQSTLPSGSHLSLILSPSK